MAYASARKEEAIVDTSRDAAWFPGAKVVTLNCSGPTKRDFAALRHENVERIIGIAARNGVDFILVQELKERTGKRAVEAGKGAVEAGKGAVEAARSYLPVQELKGRTGKRAVEAGKRADEAARSYLPVQPVGSNTDANIFYNSAKYKRVPFNLRKYRDALWYTPGSVAEIDESRMSVGFFKYRASNSASARAKDYYIMVVSWHGPQSKAKNLEKKREYFENLMITIDRFRLRFARKKKLSYDDVPVILGGDFNIEKKAVWPMKVTISRDLKFIPRWPDYEASPRRKAKRVGFQRIDEILFMRPAKRADLPVYVQSLYLEDPKPIEGYISDSKLTRDDMAWLKEKKENYESLDHDPVFAVIGKAKTRPDHFW